MWETCHKPTINGWMVCTTDGDDLGVTWPEVVRAAICGSTSRGQCSQIGPLMAHSFFFLSRFNIGMGNGPFVDGLPIKNGDFPWLC